MTPCCYGVDTLPNEADMANVGFNRRVGFFRDPPPTKGAAEPYTNEPVQFIGKFKLLYYL